MRMRKYVFARDMLTVQNGKLPTIWRELETTSEEVHNLQTAKLS